MIELKGNMWAYAGGVDVISVTTNGFVKKDGLAVMGCGCAQQASEHYRDLSLILGSRILSHGNVPHYLLTDNGTDLWSFPVKLARVRFDGSNVVSHMCDQFTIGESVPGWASIADRNLIRESAISLVKAADRFLWSKVLLPRPGCGAGELSWEIVRRDLSEILDNRFAIITY